MLPILSQIFFDAETLNDYERGAWEDITFQNVCARLVALERMRNTSNPDNFYNGLGLMYTKEYNSISDLMWKMPLDIAEEYFLEFGNVLYVKGDYFNEWVDLIGQVPPLWVISSKCLSRFSPDFIRNPSLIYKFISQNLLRYRYSALLHPYLPELNKIVSLGNGLNDLHIHLNGSTESDVLWSYILRNPEKICKDYDDIYRKSQNVRKLSTQVMLGTRPSDLYKRIKAAKSLRQEMIALLASYLNLIDESGSVGLHGKIREVRMLWNDFSPQSPYGDMIEEAMLYILIMACLRETSNHALASKFHHYMLIKGFLHKFVVMQHSQKGFEQFQLITQSSFRWRAEEEFYNRFRQLAGTSDTPYLKLIEGRITPKSSVSSMKTFVDAIFKSFDKAKHQYKLLKNAQLVLIAHFIKSPDLEKSVGICHSSLRKELSRKAQVIGRLVNEMPEYRNMLVGVDAAANELDAPPEVFAPVYRYLRYKGIKHFTYHVGEDFRHLVSGIRAIYEAVEFLDLYPSDRLGHCTAIGLDPTIWQQSIKECIMQQGEYLDNMVFAWYILEKTKSPSLSIFRSIIESRISEYSCKIYGESIAPYLLVESWKARQYDPFAYLNEKDRHTVSIASKNGYDIVKLKSEMESKGVYSILMKYHNAEGTYFNVKEEYDKLIQVTTSDMFPDYVLILLQQYVLKHLAHKGIVIETLPSSNIRIACYDNPIQHHIKRWLDNENSQECVPSVVVGSDDPGIFMTNIYNEYARILIQLSESDISSDTRVRKIQQLCNNSEMFNFFSNE